MEQNFDEKQRVDRGKAFQSGFITAIGSIALLWILTDLLSVQFTPYSAFLICIWIPLAECTIALILRDAYDGVNGRPGKVVVSALGATGLFIVVFSLAHLAWGDEVLLQGRLVTNTAGLLFSGLCMAAVAGVYWGKQWQNKKEYPED